MDYNDTHGIIQKNQSHTTHGYLPVYENTYSNKYEYMENTHKTIAITNEENGTVDEFKYDNNGNMKVNSNSNNFREMFWDESNRLRVVYDQNSYQMQHYIYDAAGERTLKASSKIENVYENGQVESNNTTMGLYTTYVSPYMVVDANQKYSKHYFNGTQRVASKIGEQDIAIFENGNQYLKQANSKAAENTPSTDFDTLKNKQITDFSYYLSKSTNNASAKNLKVNYTEYKKVDTNTETTSAKAADNNSTYAAPQYAEIYYYHSDHLGTGTFLSDFDGNPYQFFLNLPFGETMAEQHSYSGEYTNRYKFNGKELDEETGFYYYGARYYNPKFSIWLSVDPLAEKFPNHSPYSFCFNNPLRFVDPDGRAPSDWKRNINGQVVYDKTLTSTSPLGFGETYVGKTYEDVTLFGVCGLNTYNYYQEDGSIISFGGNFQGESPTEFGRITGDGIRVWGVGGDAIAGNGVVQGNDRGSGSIDHPGHDFNSLFDFGQLIGDGINWLLGNDKPTSKSTQSSTTNVPTVENLESVKYRETTGKGSRTGNMILPDFRVRDTVVPESKALEVYKKLDKKFQDDWQKQVKKDN